MVSLYVREIELDVPEGDELEEKFYELNDKLVVLEYEGDSMFTDSEQAFYYDTLVADYQRCFKRRESLYA